MSGIEKSETQTIMRQRADWSDLRVFYAVAQTGSFSEAAQQIGLSQPTVSIRVRELEGRLGVRLFNRGAQRLSLTEAGEKIYDHVVTMERSAAAVERLIVNEDKKDEGRVIVAAPDGLATYFLMPELAKFFREHPEISIGVDCGLWTDAEVGTSIDISLQFDEVSNHDIVSIPLAYYHYCLYSSQSYLDLYGVPSSLPAVADRRYVHHVAQTRQPDNWAVKLSPLRDLANVGLATNSSSAIIEAVRNGVGIGLLPTAASAFAPELVILDIEPLARLELRMCVHRDLADTARIKRVTEWLKEVFDQKTKPWFRAEFVHPRDFAAAAQQAPARPAYTPPVKPASRRPSRAG